MNKCYFGVITFWCCLASFESGWGLHSSSHLHSCDTNTFGSSIVLSFSIGLSTSLLIDEFGLTIFNVSDGVCCLFSENCVLKELEAFPKVNFKNKTYIFFIFFQKPTTFFISKL